MTEKDGLLLSEFKPKSELVVEKQAITEAKFPVIDAHMHFGPLTNGENFAEKYDTKVEVEKLKELGIEKVVNHEVLWGDRLDRVLEKIDPYHDFIVTYGSVDVESH